MFSGNSACGINTASDNGNIGILVGKSAKVATKVPLLIPGPLKFGVLPISAGSIVDIVIDWSNTRLNLYGARLFFDHAIGGTVYLIHFLADDVYVDMNRGTV